MNGVHHLYMAAPGPTAAPSQHAVVIHPNMLDHSLYGTSARMAQLHTRGLLPPHTAFCDESFIGKLLEETEVTGRQRVIPTFNDGGMDHRDCPVPVRPGQSLPPGIRTVTTQAGRVASARTTAAGAGPYQPTRPVRAPPGLVEQGFHHGNRSHTIHHITQGGYRIKQVSVPPADFRRAGDCASSSAARGSQKEPTCKDSALSGWDSEGERHERGRWCTRAIAFVPRAPQPP
ncbi:proline racemase family protein [Streptomyces arenae]|uniref:proline racemase family protein n=1 Tax=Streptomyces arenae TaxID=29301 RepID=UPI003D2C4FA6